MSHRRFKIGEICQLVRGTSPTLKTPPGPYPLVVTAEFRRTADSWQLEGPAVCVPLISSTGHGDAALHRVHYQDGKFALANLLVALLPNDPEVCYGKYLYHLLMTRKNELFVPLMLGTANVSLKERDIAEVEISLPLLAEQRRIVARIEELSAQIHDACALRQQTSEATDAIVSAGTRLVFERYTHQLGKLGEGLLSCRNGISRRPAGQEEGPIVLRLADVSDGEISLRAPRRGALTNSEVENYSLDPGDLLAVRVNGSRSIVGRFIQFNGEHEPVCYNDHLIRIRLDPSRFVPAYVARMSSSPQVRMYVESVAITTAGQLTVNQGMISNMPVPIPSLHEQRRIVAELDALHAEVDTLKRHQRETAAELDALLPAILDRAFRGEL